MNARTGTGTLGEYLREAFRDYLAALPEPEPVDGHAALELLRQAGMSRREARNAVRDLYGTAGSSIEGRGWRIASAGGSLWLLTATSEGKGR